MLLQDFDSISDVRFTTSELDAITVDRLTARFGPVVELAKLLLSLGTPDRVGGLGTFTLMFDMNLVFERFVANAMRQILAPLGLHVRAQAGGRHLLRHGEKGQFRLVPDIQVHAARQLRCIIDTKWKRLESERTHDGVSQADVYQAYAYGKEFACPDVVLLFPQCATAPERIVCYAHNSDSAFRLRISTVDVGRGVPGLRDAALRICGLEGSGVSMR
jgi:5-methylcytosine-specific restriction enzyme subunit McrC